MAVITPRVALLKQLNALNQSTYGYGEWGFGIPWERAGKTWVNVAGEGVRVTAGSDVVTFARVPLSELFSALSPVITVPRSPDIHTLLERLSRAYGVGLRPHDVTNAPITWDGSNAATVSLIATPNASRMFTGAVELSLQATVTSIDELILIPSAEHQPGLVGDAALLTAINAKNGTVFSVPNIDFTHEVVDHGNGVATTTISGVSSYGYSGNATIALKRKLASDVAVGQGFASKTAYSGSILDYIQTNTPALFGLIPRSELVDQQVTYAGTDIVNVDISIKPNSYGFYGSFNYELFPASMADAARLRGVYMNVAILPSTAANIRGVYLLVAIKDPV